MSSASTRISSKNADRNKLDIRGTRAMFENAGVMNRPRAPSPAPHRLTHESKNKSKSSGSVSSFKEKFELISSKQAEKATAARPTLRRTASEELAPDQDGDSGKFNSLPRQATGSRAEQYWMQARTKLIPEKKPSTNKQSVGKSKAQVKKNKTDTSDKPIQKPKLALTENDKIQKKNEKIETVHDRINKLTTQTDKTDSSKTVSKPEKSSIKAIWANIDKKSSPQASPKPERSVHKLKISQSDTQPPQSPQPAVNGTSKLKLAKDRYQVVDPSSARLFMKDLIEAIDNDQGVPLKQLISMFETLHSENSNMKREIESMRENLDLDDLKSLNRALQHKMETVEEQLEEAKAQIEELTTLKKALEISEERCEELEELNHHHLIEINSLRLEMDEMRDQFYDDEVHESIILQQRLDDMARSLRIIHFRLKKADGQLTEVEKEKLALMEEIKLLQGGTFTDEEIRRIQSLEGDLQNAKQATIELHCQLEQSEERRLRAESEAGRLRDELRDSYMENERLKNNLEHYKGSATANGGPDMLSPPPLIRQSSSQDVEQLKSNLEASIERETDTKEQLKFAEDEAKMLRKRLRDVEHENDALSKQLRKISNSGGKDKQEKRAHSDHIQTEVIQLENIELRRNNDQLHNQMEHLQDQIKSLKQKIDLVTNEQAQGPHSASRNSLYYETKFEIMSQEIEDLRWQLQDKEQEIKKLGDESGLKSKREQFRRAITLETDKVDANKQFDMIKQEAQLLKYKLEDTENKNSELMNDNKQLQNIIKLHKGEQSSPSVELNGNDLETQQKIYNEMESENSRLLTELSYYKENKPDIATLVDGLQKSEEKILSYEHEISNLRTDMFKMERNLQDDINSLTLKNSILRSLLEAINVHETGPPETQTVVSMEDQASNEEKLIAHHISRLPHDIQMQFREKIDALEKQLKEERQRAMAAEGLLQQVKSSAVLKRYTRTLSH